MIMKTNILRKAAVLTPVILVLGSAAFFASCNDFVDIVPKGSAIPSTVDDLGKLMNNSFASIAGENFGLADVCYNVVNVELLSDDYTGSDQPTDMYYSYFHDDPSYYNMVTWNDVIYSPAEQDNNWNGLYKSNYIVNYILENIDDAADGYEYKRNEVKGRALVHRALNFFILTNLYGKAYNASTAASDLGVPLLMESDINAMPARATVKECYEQILSDVNQAVDLLEEPVATYKHLPCKAAAIALRARVNLYMGNFEEALDDARAAVQMQSFMYDYNDFAGAIGAPSPYSVVAFGYPGDTRIYNQELIFVRPNTSFAAMSSPSDEFNKILDYDNDLRVLLFFTNLYGSRPISMMRTQQSGISVSEMYLTIAEAALRKSSPDVNTAKEALDKVRVNRYLADSYQPTTITNADDLLQEVIKERRREVSFCVTSFMDMKRWNCDSRTARTMTRTIFGQTYTMAPNDPRYCMPIPPYVMQLNPNLVDNER